MKIKNFTSIKKLSGLDNSMIEPCQNPKRSFMAGPRKLFLLAFVVIMVCAFNPVKAQNDTIQVDFGTAASPANWNFYNSWIIGADKADMVNSKGESTTVGLKIIKAFVNQKADGTATPDPITGFPGTVTADYFYSSLIANTELEFRGLSPVKDYTFIIFASKMGSGNREGKYTFTGSTESACSLVPNNNTSNIASATVKPTIDGTISFKLSPGDNNTDGSGVYHLNAMKIVYAKLNTSADLGSKKDVCSVYPNPAKDNINVQVTEPSEVMILDITGKVFLQKSVAAGNNSIILKLKSGLYMLQVTGVSKSIYTTKLIIE